MHIYIVYLLLSSFSISGSPALIAESIAPSSTNDAHPEIAAPLLKPVPPPALLPMKIVKKGTRNLKARREKETQAFALRKAENEKLTAIYEIAKDAYDQQEATSQAQPLNASMPIRSSSAISGAPLKRARGRAKAKTSTQVRSSARSTTAGSSKQSRIAATPGSLYEEKEVKMKIEEDELA